MSLDVILDEIRRSGEQRAAVLWQDANAQSESLLEQARREAEELHRAACQQEIETARQLKAQILQEAQFKLEQRKTEHIQSLVNAALEQTQAAVLQARNRPDYGAVLQSLLSEALEAAHLLCNREESLCIRCDVRDEAALNTLLDKLPQEGEDKSTVLRSLPRDEAALNTLLDKLPQEGESKTTPTKILLVCDLECSGGLKVEINGGALLLDNTLEMRFERALPHLRRFFFTHFLREMA